MKICFTGGGTMGPVTPLLAVAQVMQEKHPEVSLMWIGTREGPEGELVRAQGIPFFHIPVARFPRYVSLEWLLLPFRLAGALVMAWLLLGREKPTAIACAGGYTGVPVIIAGFFRGIPSWIHQQDVVPLLSNRLTAPFAKKITVAWKSNLASFPRRKTELVGNPVRASMLEGKKDFAYDRFKIDLSLPTVLVVGGGTGSLWLNQVMEDIGTDIAAEANVIHLTGKGKSTARLKSLHPRYHVEEFLGKDLAHVFAAADVVVARAGMGIISELAALKKAAILIPLPQSPQELNTQALENRDAAIVYPQEALTTGGLKHAMKSLLADPEKRKRLGKNIHAVLRTDVAEKLAKMVMEMVK